MTPTARPASRPKSLVHRKALRGIHTNWITSTRMTAPGRLNTITKSLPVSSKPMPNMMICSSKVVLADAQVRLLGTKNASTQTASTSTGNSLLKPLQIFLMISISLSPFYFVLYVKGICSQVQCAHLTSSTAPLAPEVTSAA